MPNSSSSSSSHCIVWMLNSIVREAFVTSVTKARPSVSFQMSQESIVPASSRPDSAFSRAPGTLSRIQRNFVAEKYASTSRPVLARIFSTSALSCSSVSHASAVRRHCHTMALHTGRPVSRSHATTVSRWFVTPMAAISEPRRFSRASASMRTPSCAT